MTRPLQPELLQVSQKAVVVKGGKVLVVRKGLDDPENAGLWEFPGGRLEAGETLEESLRREVAEETGVVVSCGAIIDAWSWFLMDGTRVLGMSRWASVDATVIAATSFIESDHIDAISWATAAELESMDLIPTQHATRVAVLAQLEGAGPR